MPVQLSIQEERLNSSCRLPPQESNSVIVPLKAMDILLRIPQAPGTDMQPHELDLHSISCLVACSLTMQDHSTFTLGEGRRCSRTSRLFGRPVPLRTLECVTWKFRISLYYHSKHITCPASQNKDRTSRGGAAEQGRLPAPFRRLRDVGSNQALGMKTPRHPKRLS